MKRIATFKIPGEVELANKHLAQFPPEQVAVVNDIVVINFDDQTYPDSYKAEELRGLILSNTKGVMTTNISIKVGEMDLVKIRTDINELEKAIAAFNTVGKDKKALYDNKKELQTNLVNAKAHEAKIVDAITGLKGTIRNFENKNKVLEGELALLKI